MAAPTEQIEQPGGFVTTRTGAGAEQLRLVSGTLKWNPWCRRCNNACWGLNRAVLLPWRSRVVHPAGGGNSVSGGSSGGAQLPTCLLPRVLSEAPGVPEQFRHSRIAMQVGPRPLYSVRGPLMPGC